MSSDFTWCVDPENPVNAYALNNVSNGNNVFLGFEIPADVASQYAGNRISAVTITAGTNNADKNGVANIVVIITSANDTVRQPAKLDKESFSVNRVELETPFEFKGDGAVRVAYSFSYGPASGWYLPVDMQPTSAPATLVAVNKKGVKIPADSEWGSVSEEVGALCMSCTIVGDKFPENLAFPTAISSPEWVKPDGTLEYALEITNRGGNAITSISTTTAVDGKNPVELEGTTEAAIQPGEKGWVYVKGVPNPGEGDHKFTVTVTKVNGAESATKSEFEGSYMSYEGLADHTVVIEEGTGTWCGYCPAGIVLLEHIQKNYGDMAALIAIHNGDRMAISAYQPVLSILGSGLPCAGANRKYMVGPTEANAIATYDAIFDLYKSYPSFVKVTSTAGRTPDTDILNIETHTEFSYVNGHKYELSYVITEDGIGPYNQTNYFAGGSFGEMGGWEKLGQSVSTVYNDVARAIYQYPGIKNSFPAAIEKGVDYHFPATMSLANVSGDDFKLITMVVDRNTNEIVNANVTKLNKQTDLGVEGVVEDAQAVKVAAGEGVIRISGGEAEVYTLDGRLVARSASDVNVDGGVYIVRTSAKAIKLLVK